MADVITDMNESNKMLKIATPYIKKMFNTEVNEIIDVENQDNDACKHLDLCCGIDYLIHFKTKNITRGFAWRAQKIYDGGRIFNSFTIRKERESGAVTEYEKRKIAICLDGEYPYYTIHSYYDETSKKILSICIAKTKDIIECISKGLWSENETGKDKVGQAKFYYIPWSTMKSHGYKINEYYNFS